jgi:hypothetical protein
MDKFNLFSDKQFGFMGGRSTLLQLLKVLDKWTSVLDKGGVLNAVYMDFMQAFSAVIIATFHFSGTIPVSNDFLKIMNKGLSITFANSYSTFGCALSGPGDFVVFSPRSNFLISSCENDYITHGQIQPV